MIARNFTLALAALAVASSQAGAQLKVVTSTTDLYDIAKAVGGSRITATHIGEGYQDPHFIEAKPSFVLQLRKADVWAFVGLDLEIGWMPLLLDGARNPRVRPGGSGYVDVSKAMPVMDVPQGNVDRSMGDVHPLGNPHYWLDPENGRRIARLFKDKFTQLDRAHAADYDRNERAFEARLNAAEKAWQPQLAQIRGKSIIAYHTSWRYFAAYTGAKIVALTRGAWYYSAEEDVGYCAAIRTHATILARDPIFGDIAYGGVATRKGPAFEVIPRDGLRVRFHVMRGDQRLHLELDHDGYAKEQPIVVADDLSRIQFSLENRTGGAHATGLWLAGLPAGEYEVTVDGKRVASVQGAKDATISLPVGAAPTSAVTIRRR